MSECKAVLIRNGFCSTGKGGGADNSCGAGSSKGTISLKDVSVSKSDHQVLDTDEGRIFKAPKNKFPNHTPVEKAVLSSMKEEGHSLLDASKKESDTSAAWAIGKKGGKLMDEHYNVSRGIKKMDGGHITKFFTKKNS